MSPDQSRVESIIQCPRPSNQKEVKQFWGLAGYYRKYIKDFVSIANPLNSLLRTDVSFNWTSSTERSFLELKKWLSFEPVLVCPNFKTMFVV